MDKEFYFQLADKIISGKPLLRETAQKILTSADIELLPLLSAAYDVRRKFTGKDVTIHIINNVQNGHCSEDCHYCSQSRDSKAEIEQYSMKPDEEILAEAKNAYEKGAFRYCMVFSGRQQTQKRIEHLCGLVRKIKSMYPIEVCVSPGILNRKEASMLKAAGLNRLNHNLNTSEKFYSKICTTHNYADRLGTLHVAHEEGLQICSGVIIGMGESALDVIEMALALRKIKAESIPVNFFIPIKGVTLKEPSNLTPEYCLRVLCLFRFLNPDSELRVAAGREIHLRSMQVMAFYPANSLFLDGYLNVKGASRRQTLKMLKDAGFTIKSDRSLDELLEKEDAACQKNILQNSIKHEKSRIPPQNQKSRDSLERYTFLCDKKELKTLKELRPQIQKKNKREK